MGIGLAIGVGLSIASTVGGILANNADAKRASDQAGASAAALERQRIEDLRLSKEQISDIRREQRLADEDFTRTLFNLNKFSIREVGAIKAQQGASGAKGLTASIVVAEAKRNRDLDEAAFRNADAIDRAARFESIRRTRKAGRFLSRESLTRQGDLRAAGAAAGAAGRLRNIGTVIGGARRIAGASFPRVSETTTQGSTAGAFHGRDTNFRLKGSR